jgi:hypothetical protein
MHNIFTKLIKRQSTEEEEKPRPLYLPRNRLRVITPSASRESLSASAISSTAKSPFFAKLPFEIRQKILKHAFGDKTICMSLDFDYPVEGPIYRHRRHRCANCARRAIIRAITLKHIRKMIKGKKKRWFWYCTVCDRCSQSIKNTLRDESNCDGNSIPGVSWCCDTWFIGASVLRIGVMGWLLSCRQALVPYSY